MGASGRVVPVGTESSSLASTHTNTHMKLSSNEILSQNHLLSAVYIKTFSPQSANICYASSVAFFLNAFFLVFLVHLCSEGSTRKARAVVRKMRHG